MKPLGQNTLIQNRYLIVHLIGKGGMGEVYLAVDQRLGSAVAIKRTFFAGDEMLGNAFEREARVLARLRHPVLPKVSDHFAENDQQFLVMEHISGDDLSKRIETLQKPFPLSWVMFWADQLLDALSYLHSHEPPIIHRDIKPQNLKLTDENHIILLDFGLSKSSTGNTNVSGGSSSGSTGSVVGYTPHYAPMEQIRGIGTSARSDLYSLSATLYQLMTNVVPADALSRADAMLNGMPDPITPISAINPEVPDTVSAVILRGMEVSQEKRFENAREMQKALRKAFSEMQEAMSAKTVVISGGVETGRPDPQTNDESFQATEVMDPEALRAISNPVSANMSKTGFSESIAQPTSNVSSYPSAVSGNENAVPGDSIRQSDVKTEVFIAGANSLPIPPQEEPKYEPVPVNNVPVETEPVEQENFALTTDYPSFSADQTPETGAISEGFSPDATAPYIAFQGSGQASSYGQPSEYSQVSEGSPENTPMQEMAVGSQNQFRSPQPAVRSAVPAKKSSTGKIIAILGGLFVVLALLLGGLGGGYYYYVNYYAGGTIVEPTPSPTPLPTPTPTPTPEPTPTPSDLSGADNTNSNSNSNSLVVEPTPTPRPINTPSGTTERPDTRPTPAGTRPTPKPQPSKTVKPSPTKKPGPDILQ